MMLLLFIIIAAMLAFGLYRIAQAAFCLPSGKAIGAIKNIHGKRYMAER